MNNISIIGKRCCGCRSCEQICPKGAILFRADDEGFMHPEVSDDLCIDCGVCLKACPVNEPLFIKNEQLGYAAKLKNRITLRESSSGGLFSAMTDYVFSRGGAVCGCSTDKNLMPVHTIALTKEQSRGMLGSKYVQSNIEGIYSRIKELLNSGTLVLFTGVPCQVAGLKSFLRKDYETLYCVDIICHGVPSRKLYAAYLQWLGKKYKGTIEKFEFRSKKRHQWSLTQCATVRKASGKIIQYERMASLDPYYYNFLEGNSYRESCYTCPYGREERIGDVTIGDFWGLENIHPDLYDLDGVSCALVNSEKGRELWKEISEFIDSSEVNPIDIISNNGNLRHATKRPEARDVFYKLLNEGGFDSIPYSISVKQRIVDTIKDMIPNRIRYNIKKMLKKYV